MIPTHNLLRGGILLIFALWLSACMTRPKAIFAESPVPAAPNYNRDDAWAALPWKDDPADLTAGDLVDRQDEAQVDVFWLHPTSYTGKRGDILWNAPVNNADINERTLEGSIQFQASIFNGVGRVFAPYYRQAHLSAYYNTKDTLSVRRAFELAYSDVRQAFRNYLSNHNRGRPIILASHSQGTTHAVRLLQEFFDGTELQQQLVAAYVAGIAVPDTLFQTLRPCQDSTELGCYMSWRTFKKGKEPKEAQPAVVVTNPLLWTTTDTYAAAALNKGAVLRPWGEILANNVDAQIHGPILWTSKPKFPGSWLLWGKNYHAGDFNLFYLDIRENAQLRAATFLEQSEGRP